MRILLCAPAREPAPVLARFLAGIAALDPAGCTVDWLLADDNDDPAASALLEAARNPHGTVRVEPVDPATRPPRPEGGDMHHWTAILADRLGAVKDHMLRAALAEGYDATFLVDADLVLQPGTLRVLLAAERDVCCEVFWTAWRPGEEERPNVWLRDQYWPWDAPAGDPEATAEARSLFGLLRQPGVHEVGGLGACTLVRRCALEAGVRFERVRNVSWWGEDRHFCLRAAVAGIGLWADTHCPPQHLYREGGEAEPAPEPEEAADPPSAPAVLVPPPLPRIVLSMCVGNERGRWLADAIGSAAGLVFGASVVDDASDDGTWDLLVPILGLYGYPDGFEMVRNRRRRFGDEWRLRRQQWDALADMRPEWVLCLDADEILPDDAAERVRAVLGQHPDADVVGFRLFDMWSPTHYRDDGLWGAHRRHMPFLVRWRPNACTWRCSPVHCGRFPLEVLAGKRIGADVRVRHMGWSREEDRRRKQARYLASDPEGVWGSLEQYRSITDPAPNLVAWEG